MSRPAPRAILEGMPRSVLFSLRWILPVAVCAAGLAVYFLSGGELAVHALSSLFGAGGAILLINMLLRGGIESQDDRDREQAARRFLDRYGLWPDEVPPGWTPPDAPDAATAWRRVLDEERRAAA